MGKCMTCLQPVVKTVLTVDMVQMTPVRSVILDSSLTIVGLHQPVVVSIESFKYGNYYFKIMS